MLDRFHLEDDLVCDDEVEFLIAQQLAPIRHLILLLAFELNPGSFELDGNGARVDSFAQAGPKFPMDGDATANRCAHQLFDLFRQRALNAQHGGSPYVTSSELWFFRVFRVFVSFVATGATDAGQ